VLAFEQGIDSQAHGELDGFAGRPGGCNDDDAASDGLGRAKGLEIWRKGVVTLSVHDLAARLPHEPKDFSRLGVAVERFLGKQLAPVHLDLEHAARRFDQLHFRLRVRLANLCRQTGGSGLVVSNDTVFDHHTHSQ